MIIIDNKKIPWRAGMTLDKVIVSLKNAQAYAVVRLNGKLVCRPKFSSTIVNDGDEVVSIPLIVGG